MKYKIGTRRSDLAKIQSRLIQSQLEAQGLSCELIEIESEGDKNRTTPLFEFEATSPGLFTKQLEQALLKKEIDIAVHSLKDLPTIQPPGLQVAAVTERVGSGDTLIIHEKSYCADKPLFLAKGAKIGSSSLRREAQLLNARPDIRVEVLRGNVPTRVESVRSGKMDGAVLAAAGLRRLGITETPGVKFVSLPLEQFLPAPGQGSLAIEVRSDADTELVRAVRALNHPSSCAETHVERSILRGLEGGCTLPLGVLCQKTEKGYLTRSFLGLFHLEGSKRNWKRFETFNLCAASEEVAIDDSIQYFKPFLEESRGWN